MSYLNFDKFANILIVKLHSLIHVTALRICFVFLFNLISFQMIKSTCSYALFPLTHKQIVTFSTHSSSNRSQASICHQKCNLMLCKPLLIFLELYLIDKPGNSLYSVLLFHSIIISKADCNLSLYE